MSTLSAPLAAFLLKRLVLILPLSAVAMTVFASTSEAARVTQLTNAVEIQPPHGPMRLASMHEAITDGAVLRTKSDARIELTFADERFTRFDSATTVRVESEDAFKFLGGAMLLHVPRNSSPVAIDALLVVVSTTGATFVLETHNFPSALTDNAAPVLAADARYRLNVLEGIVRLCRQDQPEACIEVKAKQAVIGSADRPLGTVVKFDAADFLQTSTLVTAFSAMAPNVLAAIDAPARRRSLTAFLRPIGVDAGNVGASAIGTINPANLSDRGNEVSPSEERLTICHSGQTLTLPRAAAEQHLRSHPGDTAGACH